VAAAISSGNPGTQVVSPAISNNGTALTWTQVLVANAADSGGQGGAAGIFYTWLTAARTGMTVTCTGNYYGAGVKVFVITGANATNPIGGSEKGNSTAQNITTNAFTTQGNNSFCILSVEDWSTATAPTSSDTTFQSGGTLTDSGGAGYKTLGAAGTQATCSIKTGASTSQTNYVTCEILAAASPFVPSLRYVNAAVQRASYF
jgi:hypothetical protein